LNINVKDFDIKKFYCAIIPMFVTTPVFTIIPLTVTGCLGCGGEKVILWVPAGSPAMIKSPMVLVMDE
jgi:hypothetical protein